MCRDNEHYLSLDEKAFDLADADMQPIFHRLMMAASNVEMRQDMNVEDEYYSIIKEQEGKVYGLERDLAETRSQLAETSSQLAEKTTHGGDSSQLAETSMDSWRRRTDQLAEKEDQLAAKNEQLRQMVGMLMQAGHSMDAIANRLHIDREALNALLDAR